MPTAATAISVTRARLVEIEQAVANRIGQTMQELERLSKERELEEADLRRLMRQTEELAAFRVVGQAAALKLRLSEFDFGFDDEHEYEGPLAEAEELAHVLGELVVPFVTSERAPRLHSRLVAMLRRLDQQIHAVNQQVVEVDLDAIGVDPDDLPVELTGRVSDMPVNLPAPARQRLPVVDASPTAPPSRKKASKGKRKKK